MMAGKMETETMLFFVALALAPLALVLARSAQKWASDPATCHRCGMPKNLHRPLSCWLRFLKKR
jgi:hypothetical protein